MRKCTGRRHLIIAFAERAPPARHAAPSLPLGKCTGPRSPPAICDSVPLLPRPALRDPRCLRATCARAVQVRVPVTARRGPAARSRSMSSLAAVTGHGGTVPNFINGEFVESKTDRFIDCINPVRLPSASPSHLVSRPAPCGGAPLLRL
jgi:hypothetical protein